MVVANDCGGYDALAAWGSDEGATVCSVTATLRHRSARIASETACWIGAA